MKDKFKPITELTCNEYGLLQYLCECAEYGTPVELDEKHKVVANRLGNILINLMVSGDNQVEVTPREDTNEETWKEQLERANK